VNVDLSKSVTRWPLSFKLRRGVWTFLLQPLVRWLPKVLSPVRIAALRAMGARIGPNCLILPGVTVLMPWNLHLADHVAIGARANIYNFAPVRVGRMTVISQYVYLCTGSHDYRKSDMPLTFAPISIGEQVWLAAGAFVAPGISIADGAVVGAMSVVTKSLSESWSVYAGNPCRKIKARDMHAES
jgi:putative colanic acid biosynthesis acetyltransferase WcaF